LITAIHGIERLCGGAPAHAPDATMPVLPELWNDSVVVQGAGPVAIAAAAVARNAGARRVLLVGGPSHRLELAKRFGVDMIMDIDEVPQASDRIDAVRSWTGGHGADVVLECVGAPAAVAEGMEMCRDGGKYLVLGHYCDAGPTSLNPHVITRKELEMIGSWSSEPRHLKAALDFLRETGERFPFASLVSHRHGLDEANDALMDTASWRSLKSVIVPG
jgi:threonine dehydrogenase-like Zn-dependent dehydrogenase